MRGLSISKAWDETSTLLSRDGRLYVSIALSLVALPALISGLINPRGMADTNVSGTVALISLLLSIVALAGQLSLIRLAFAPSVTVAEAIKHGMRRTPIYLLAAILIVLFLMVAAIPFAFILESMGIPIERTVTVPATPGFLAALLLYLAIFCFIGVKMLMCAPAVTAEPIGPIAAIKRSWQLTAGHWWHLFGFLVLFFVAAIIILFGVNTALGFFIVLWLGPIQPMSASALVSGLAHALLNAVLTTLLSVMLARIYVQLAGREHAEAGVPSTGI